MRTTALIVFCLAFAPNAARAAPPPEVLAAVEFLEAGDVAAARRLTANLTGDAGGWRHYLEGRLQLRDGAVDASIESLTAAVEKDPAAAPFRRWLGEAYIARIDSVGLLSKRGVAKQALSELREAARLDPQDFGTRETLVGYYLKAPAIVGGGEAKADAEAADYARLDVSGGHRLTAQIRMHQEDFEGAIAEYQAASRAKPDDAPLSYQLGMALQGQKRYSEAFAAFERAIELNPAYMDPLYQLGRTAVLSGTNLERGAECMRTYLSRDVPAGSPAPEHAHWRLGMIYALQDDGDRARREFEEALEIDPKHEPAKAALEALGSS